MDKFWIQFPTTTLPNDFDIPYRMNDIDVHANSSVFVFLAMFGGSTFVLFLLCYFCQKKLQVEDSSSIRSYPAPREVFVIPTINGQIQNTSGAYPRMPSPPPEYNTLTKKVFPVFQYDIEPPSYESVVHNFPQPNLRDEAKLDKQENNSHSTK